VAYTGLSATSTVSEQKASGLFHLWIQPSVQIILTATFMKFRQYLPMGPEKLRLQENWTFPKQTLEAGELGNLLEKPFYKKYAEVIQEDVGINLRVQKGFRSGAYKPGRYALDEFILHRLANRVLDRVIGPEDDVAPATNERARRDHEPALGGVPAQGGSH
jgi:choline monooxygenase